MKVKNWLSKEWQETKVLFRSIPALPFMLFALSIILMNLLASKLIVQTNWLMLDAGILISWIAFLGMDMMVKRFGPKASIKITVAALLVNVLVAGVFSIVASIPVLEGQYTWELAGYASSFQWWIIGVSTLAFIVSGVVSSLLHWAIRKTFKEETKEKFSAFAVSSWTSTIVAQFIDNMVFGFLFSYLAFGGTILSVVMMAATGCVVELICQALFSRSGWKMAERWRKQGVGQEYIDLIDNKEKAQ